jgi:hypothetical protein
MKILKKNNGSQNNSNSQPNQANIKKPGLGKTTNRGPIRALLISLIFTFLASNTLAQETKIFPPEIYFGNPGNSTPEACYAEHLAYVEESNQKSTNSWQQYYNFRQKKTPFY